MKSDPFPPVRACIFDVDGTLLDSEDVYTQIYNKILSSYGVADYTWDIKAIQQSRGTPGIIRLLEWADLPLSVDEWKVEEKAHQGDFLQCKPLPGVMSCLQRLSNALTPIDMALASSAGKHLFDIKTMRAPELRRYFPTDLQVFGDDTDMDDCGNKPSPDIFHLALHRINKTRTAKGDVGLEKEECLIFEDSIAGVEAGRRAGMRVVWIPHKGLREVCRGKEHDVLLGLTAKEGLPSSPASFQRETTHARCDRCDLREGSVISDDGWAEMLMSLEDFSFEKYGIEL
ncbi:MAG: hypothetical protein Q9160_008173 [Pyrenula sp. 1 TL-2023]